jgi:hypothetical protein
MIFVLLQNDQTGSVALSFGINRLLCEAEHSPPSAAEVKNEWREDFYSVTMNVTSVSVIIMSQYFYSLFSPCNHS